MIFDGIAFDSAAIEVRKTVILVVFRRKSFKRFPIKFCLIENFRTRRNHWAQAKKCGPFF